MNKFIAERQVQYPMFNQYEPSVNAPIAFLKLLNVKVNNVLQKQQNLMQELYPEIFLKRWHLLRQWTLLMIGRLDGLFVVSF